MVKGNLCRMVNGNSGGSLVRNRLQDIFNNTHMLESFEYEYQNRGPVIRIMNDIPGTLAIYNPHVFQQREEQGLNQTLVHIVKQEIILKMWWGEYRTQIRRSLNTCHVTKRRSVKWYRKHTK